MRSFFTILFILISFIRGFSQLLELGVFGGVTNYLGDLAPVAFIPQETHPSFGADVIVNVHKFFSIKGAVYNGTISGSDARNGQNQQFRVKRNLSFRSNISEMSVMAQVNLFGYRTEHFFGKYVTPYAEIGFGVFHFNPQTEWNGQWYDLQPMHTEGQGLPGRPKEYHLTQACVPLGVGFKYAVNQHWNLSFDIAFRKTTTDYLDDVSSYFVDSTLLATNFGETSAKLADRSGEVLGENFFWDGKERGNPKLKDWYFFPGLSLSYTFVTGNHEYHGHAYHGPKHPFHCFAFRH